MAVEKPKKSIKKSVKKTPERTKQIAVKSEPAVQADQSPLLKITKQSEESAVPNTTPASGSPEQTFQLGVQIPHAAHEVLKNSAKIPKYAQKGEAKNSPEAASTTPDSQTTPSHPNLHQPQPAPQKRIMGTKIWNTLEWIATSALIFTVLFFVINFNAYSTLFLDKLNQLRGGFQLNPAAQSLVQPQSQTQQPLPITATSDQSKKQIPYLVIEVAPPDDRVIIPRINRNVPVVKVSSENLIKRDWGALEGDIQQALRYGVVHYPGTPYPGEGGNVVITGHSSYFSWDPGRFKDVFALLHEVVIGDTVIVYHNQKKYYYQVYNTEVITPDKVDVLTQNGDNRLTLITCTPVGTNLKRLVVFAKPIADPTKSPS